MGRFTLGPAADSYLGFYSMEAAHGHPFWNDTPLEEDLIGLAWPGHDDPVSLFAAAGRWKVILVPGNRMAAFLNAHPAARFVVDLQGPHNLRPTDAAVDRLVVANRLYDVRILSDVIRLAVRGVSLPSLKNPDGADWTTYCSVLRDTAARLLQILSESVHPAGAGYQSMTARFGLLGIGLDVRGALAATAGGLEVRVSDEALQRVNAALDEREHVARAALAADPRAKKFANKQGVTHFLDRGDPGNNFEALATFVRDIIPRVSLRDGLPVPTPDDNYDIDAWRLLAPHDKALTAWLELYTLSAFRNALNDGNVLRPRIDTFPELRLTGPSVSYLRRRAGSRVLSPVSDGTRFVIVRLPDLEMRALAVCLDERCEDITLREMLLAGNTDAIRDELMRRIVGSSVDELQSMSPGKLHELAVVCQAALKYYPCGVNGKTLEHWLLNYEYGIQKPKAAWVAHAWSELVKMVPGLHHYCATDGINLIACNLGVTAEMLVSTLRDSAEELGLQSHELGITNVVNFLLDDQKVKSDRTKRLFRLFTSRTAFPDNPLADRAYLNSADLVESLLSTAYLTPTGRIYSRALPLQRVGRDHLELADGIRKATFYALVAAGFLVAGFDENEFAVLNPRDETIESDRSRAESAVKTALAGWADTVAHSVMTQITALW